ncbi:MAG: glycosyltransferase [Gemmatimonadota bacterium]
MTPPAVVALLLSPFVNDSRVLRVNRTLATHGYGVTLLALHEDGLPRSERVAGFQVRRFALSTKRWSRRPAVQLIKYLECMVRMAWTGVRLRPSFVHANDLNSLPIGYCISRLTGAALVYDSHEYWAGCTAMRRFAPWVQRVALRMERMIAKRARAVITVSPGIVDRLQPVFGSVPIHLVRNVPDRTTTRPATARAGIRASLGLKAETPLLLFQGYVVPGRGVEVVIAAMAQLPAPIHFAILGNGTARYLSGLRVLAEQLGVAARVSFVPAVPSEELVEYARTADFGISPMRPGGISDALSLPNKVFEYLQSGLPVIHSGSDEVRRLLVPYDVGRWFAEGDATALASVIEGLLADPDELRRLRRNCVRAASELQWENEQQRLLEAYASVSGR